MKQVNLILVATLLAVFSDAEAALPPLWDSVRELEGVLKDPELGKHLDASDSILTLERAPDGILITTQTKDIWVTVERKEMENPGPAQFEYYFQPSRSCCNKVHKSSDLKP